MMRRAILLWMLLACGSVAAFSGTSIVEADLPREAQAVLRKIDAGGPFPYRQDGVVFGNREKLLPKMPRGYYHEYTVPTPGSRTRGARRIVTGGEPPEVYYYTHDHYQSFRRIVRQ